METWYIFNEFRYAADKWEWAWRVDGAGRVDVAGRVEKGGTVDGTGRLAQLNFFVPLSTFKSLH